MKVVFVVQGEGRGHLTQALALRQMLVNEGHEVVKVLVGKSRNRKVPDFFLDQIGCQVELLTVQTFCLPKTTVGSIFSVLQPTTCLWHHLIFLASSL